MINEERRLKRNKERGVMKILLTKILGFIVFCLSVPLAAQIYYEKRAVPLDVSITVSVEIPQRWEHLFKKLSPDACEELLGYVRTFKKDFAPTVMGNQLVEDSISVSRYMGVIRKSDTMKEFIEDNLLPTRHNVLETLQYLGSNEVSYAFLEALEKSLENMLNFLKADSEA